jgi:WD40 repeat protein
MRLFPLRLLAVGLMAAVASSASAQEAKKKVTFDDHVLPVFRAKCLACHNPDKKASGLDLSTYSGTMTGGASGTVVEAGQSGNSYLFSLVTHQMEPKMPPASDKIAPEMIAAIKDWIDGGLLENAGSKAKVSNKPKVDLTLKTAPSGKPEGPPPMPERLSVEPVVRTAAETAVISLATSPWAPLVAVAGQKQIVLYNTQSLELVGVLPFPEGIPNVVRFSRSGGLLMAGGGRGAAKGRVVVWNVKTGERLFEVGDELDAVLGADISADQTRIALGGPNKIVRIFSTADGSLQSEIKKHTDWVYCTCFSPDGVLLCTGDRNGGVHVWEAATGREFLTLSGHTGAITGIAWRGDSNIVATTSEDGTVKMWEMENGGMVKNWGAHGGGSQGIWFTRDGRLVTVGRDRVAKLWDQNGAVQKQFDAFPDIALRVTYCDETNRVIAGDWTGAINVWNADGTKVGSLTSNPQTIKERLDAATAALPQKQAAATPLAADYAAKVAAAQKIEAELAAAAKAVTDNTALVTTYTNNLATAKATVAKVAGELDASQKAAVVVEQALAPLNEAAKKAADASAAAAGDKALADAAAAAKKAADDKAAELDAAKKVVVAKTAELEAGKVAQAAVEKQLADTNVALAAAQKKVADTTPTLKPAQDAAAAAKAPSDAAAQAVVATQQMIERLKTDADFAVRVKVYLEKQQLEASAVAAFEGEKATVDALKAEVAKSQLAAAEAPKVVEASLATLNAGKANVTKVTGELAAAQKAATDLEGAVATLKESLAKANEAVAKLPGDKALTDLASAVKAATDAKAAGIDPAKKVATDKAAELEKAKAAVPVMEKAYADAVAAAAAAVKKATDLAATVKPAEDKLPAVKQVADAATAVAAEAKKAVDAMKPQPAAPPAAK